ncbi:hypothetical protein HanRHA438_Chr15g0703441 [Helianthus annuus]|nr:hypothetical protein HanRHA438_Chr15g0703441 [Helianthus annuus]
MPVNRHLSDKILTNEHEQVFFRFGSFTTLLICTQIIKRNTFHFPITYKKDAL